MRFTELVDIAKEKTGSFGGDKLMELADAVNSAYDELVQRVGEQVVTSLVAGTFLKAAALQRSFRIGTMLSSHIEIELSPLPAVRFFFVPQADQALHGKLIESSIGDRVAVT